MKLWNKTEAKTPPLIEAFGLHSYYRTCYCKRCGVQSGYYAVIYMGIFTTHGSENNFYKLPHSWMFEAFFFNPPIFLKEKSLLYCIPRNETKHVVLTHIDRTKDKEFNLFFCSKVVYIFRKYNTAIFCIKIRNKNIFIFPGKFRLLIDRFWRFVFKIKVLYVLDEDKNITVNRRVFIGFY